MKEFYYKKGNLFAEEVKIKDVANHIKTPFYVYSKLAMERRFDHLKNSLGGLRHRIFYSVKANFVDSSNKSVSKALFEVEIVSVKDPGSDDSEGVSDDSLDLKNGESGFYKLPSAPTLLDR